MILFRTFETWHAFLSFSFWYPTYEFIPTSSFFYASTVLWSQYLNMKRCYIENPWTTSTHLLLFPPRKNLLLFFYFLWVTKEKKKVILSNRNWTFYSIAFLPILYKSTVLFYLFFCVHSRQKEEDGYLCNVYLGLLLLSCVHQWCLFLMRLLSPSFAVFFPVLYFQVIFVNSGVALWVYYYFVAKNWVGMHV